MSSREDEVAFGTSFEESIVARWLDLSGRTNVAMKSPGEFSDHDFLLVGSSTGLVEAYVEVKMRRCSVDKFRTSIWPMRKHEHALKLSVPLIGVMQYTDALVEVDLGATPDWVGQIRRGDRHQDVDHVGYEHRKVWRL